MKKNSPKTIILWIERGSPGGVQFTKSSQPNHININLLDYDTFNIRTLTITDEEVLILGDWLECMGINYPSFQMLLLLNHNPYYVYLHTWMDINFFFKKNMSNKKDPDTIIKWLKEDCKYFKYMVKIEKDIYPESVLLMKCRNSLSTRSNIKTLTLTNEEADVFRDWLECIGITSMSTQIHESVSGLYKFNRWVMFDFENQLKVMR